MNVRRLLWIKYATWIGLHHWFVANPIVFRPRLRTSDQLRSCSTWSHTLMACHFSFRVAVSAAATEMAWQHDVIKHIAAYRFHIVCVCQKCHWTARKLFSHARLLASDFWQFLALRQSTLSSCTRTQTSSVRHHGAYCIIYNRWSVCRRLQYASFPDFLVHTLKLWWLFSVSQWTQFRL